jgi:hypothetical protein
VPSRKISARQAGTRFACSTCTHSVHTDD